VNQPTRAHSPRELQQICRLVFFWVAFVCVAAILLLSPTSARAQGCTQCLDNTAATPPRTQAAYRHAILLMTITGGGLFVGTLILLKRHR
jgi:hypothetical protein